MFICCLWIYYRPFSLNFVLFPHKCLEKCVKDRGATVLATSHFADVIYILYSERWKNSCDFSTWQIVEDVNKHNNSINVGSKTINSNIFIHAPVHCWELDYHIYHSFIIDSTSCLDMLTFHRNSDFFVLLVHVQGLFKCICCTWFSQNECFCWFAQIF